MRKLATFPVAWLSLSLLLAVPTRFQVTAWHSTWAMIGAMMAVRDASALPPCQGCDCCPEDQECHQCGGADHPICCPIGWQFVKDFTTLVVHCETPCPDRSQCLSPCSDGEGECYAGCCTSVDQSYCYGGYTCISDPCPEASRCGRECCGSGETCVAGVCEGGCENPCGGSCCAAGQTCQNDQCVGGGGGSTPTPVTTPTGALVATVTATPTDPGDEPTPAPRGCDAGKIGCVAKRQACFLKVHATAEKKGVEPDADGLFECVTGFEGCVAKLESKQNPVKPKTLCTVTGQAAALATAGAAFVTDVVTTIHPSFPTVGPASLCDAGKKGCASKRASCLLKLSAAAVKKGVLVDDVAAQKCKDKFDGGADGFAKGCVGKLQAKQNPGKPKTLCAVTDDGTALAAAVDAFIDATLAAILDVD